MDEFQDIFCINGPGIIYGRDNSEGFYKEFI